jgi:2-methylisocitrate lyase-like PEP mutase family enzyme
MKDKTDLCRRFRDLHASGCFVIPNPWDLGSARALERLGFPALATTSSGFAWSQGKPDHGVNLQETLQHLKVLTHGVRVPVNADLGAGFATDAAAVMVNVAAAALTGIAGVSIEDGTGDPHKPLFDFQLSVERIRAARHALEGTGVMLTARTEGFLLGKPDLRETIRRLTAYADAGADCLYAPGIRQRGEITGVVAAVAPKPVNVLVGSSWASVAELAYLGVRRISVGGGLARTAWTSFLEAAREIAGTGTFNTLDQALPYDEINGAFEH